MALLDTLKKGLGTAVSYATAPITAPFKAAASSVKSTVDLARKAASMAPTNDPNKLFSSTGGQKSLQNDTVFTVPQGGGMQTVTKSPTPTLQQSNPITPKGDLGVPQIGSNSVAPKAVTVPNPIAPAPKATTPAVNTQVSGSNPFGNSNYTPTFSNPNPAPVTLNNSASQGIVQENSKSIKDITGYDVGQTLPATSPTELSDLQKALLGTYNQTPEEKQAQDALQALAQQQADLSGAYRSGTNKIGEQPIVLDLLRGQQQALQKQYEGQVGALADQSKPLEVQLANLVANREQQNKALSTQYGFATEAQKRQDAIDQARATGNKPIEVGGSLLQLNPQTGQYDVIYKAPSEDANGFTLSEGQIRYDANGNQIASGGAKSDTASTPSSYKEWQLAGSPGTYLDYLKGGAAGGNKMTAGQAETLAEATNLKSNVLGPLYSLIKDQSKLFGPLAGRVGGANPYDTNAQSAQANFNNAAQLVGSFLEGGKLAEGDIGRYRSMLPQLTDTPAVAQQKLDAVAKLIESKQQEYLTSYGQAGFNTSGYQGSQGAQMDDNAKKSALLQGGVSQALLNSWVASGHSLDDLAREKGVTFTNASNSALNSSKTTAVTSVKPNGSWGGQCGEFIHNIVKDYPYGLNGINQKEAIINVPKTQLPQVGDVLIQRVAGSTGHVAVVNHVDPTTGKITLTESNWNNNEKVSNTRQMSVNSPTISGYYRGSLAV